MPKTRSKVSDLLKDKVSFTECDDSSSEHDEDDNADSGLFHTIFQLAFMRKRPRKRRTSAGRTPKRGRRGRGAGSVGRGAQNQCVGNCSCACNSRKTTTRKGPAKNKEKPAAASTSTKPDEVLDLDSDDEVMDTSLKVTQVDTIKNKMDNFFKSLESDDDEVDEKVKTLNSAPVEKSKSFYTILTDSEDEADSKLKEKVSALINSPTKPSTSSATNAPNAELKGDANRVKINAEKNTQDLFAYVDELLNEYNEVVDLTDNKPKENAAVLSLDDLKKRTGEILGGVSSLIDVLLDPKPKEPEKTASELPAKEVPICPICLEELGGLRQAMTTLCGHIFCEPCLAEVVRTTKKCPSCRKGLSKAKYHPVYI